MEGRLTLRRRYIVVEKVQASRIVLMKKQVLVAKTRSVCVEMQYAKINENEVPLNAPC